MASVLRQAALFSCKKFANNFLARNATLSASRSLALKASQNNFQTKPKILLPQKSLQAVGTRFYSHVPLTKPMITDRTIFVLKMFDKVDPDKVTLDSNFTNDLGLDSLDHVEVIMAIEDEFAFEIPDSDAERLVTPNSIIQYICDKFDIYE